MNNYFFNRFDNIQSNLNKAVRLLVESGVETDEIQGFITEAEEADNGYEYIIDTLNNYGLGFESNEQE